jgi:secretion/DNA translocation related CpaE-like protein
MPDPDLLLVATADERLLDDALRWCAAAGAAPEVATHVAAVRRSWRSAPAVIVGADLAAALADADLPRRDHVLLVTEKPDECWAHAVRLGAAGVHTPSDEDDVLDALASALDGRGEAVVVSVVGGSGGVGASTLASALGLAAARRGLRTLLFDADPLGGGLELVVGAEQAVGLRWGDLDTTRGRLSAGSLADVLPRHRGLATLSWDRGARSALPASEPSVLTAAVRGFDLVVADVPRHLDPPGSEIIGRSVLTVLVVAEEVCALGAARHVLDRVRERAANVAVVSVSRPGGVGPSAVSQALGQPVLARHRHDRRIRGAIDRGLGPGRSRAARRTAAGVLDALGLGPT